MDEVFLVASFKITHSNWLYYSFFYWSLPCFHIDCSFFRSVGSSTSSTTRPAWSTTNHYLLWNATDYKPRIDIIFQQSLFRIYVLVVCLYKEWLFTKSYVVYSTRSYSSTLSSWAGTSHFTNKLHTNCKQIAHKLHTNRTQIAHKLHTNCTQFAHTIHTGVIWNCI